MLAMGCAGGGAQSPGPGAVTTGLGLDAGRRAVDAGARPHVFVVAMENENADAIYGNSSAPYINLTLLPAYASAANFTDELPELPSEPHYVWMEAGTNAFSDHTFTTDSSPSASNSTATTSHLANQIEAAGLDWMDYDESVDLSAQPCPIAGSGVYVPRHDPFLFFQDVVGAPPSTSAGRCAAHHRPLSALPGDLAAARVATYVFLTPDLCHDMHGSSSCPAGDQIQAGDAWLSTALPPIIDYVNAAGGVIFVVWDEGTTLPFVAIGPGVKRGYSSSVTFDHGSLLKSVEEILALPILPTVAGAADFGDLFSSGAVP